MRVCFVNMPRTVSRTSTWNLSSHGSRCASQKWKPPTVWHCHNAWWKWERNSTHTLSTHTKVSVLIKAGIVTLWTTGCCSTCPASIHRDKLVTTTNCIWSTYFLRDKSVGKFSIWFCCRFAFNGFYTGSVKLLPVCQKDTDADGLGVRAQQSLHFLLHIRRFNVLQHREKEIRLHVALAARLLLAVCLSPSPITHTHTRAQI